METHGRYTLKCSLREDELNENTILEALDTLIPLHAKNKCETKYLKDYLVGVQDIREKQKYTRKEINNKMVENWTYAVTEFMKSFILNEPIQYVQLNNQANKELSVLNNYMVFEGKDKKDLDLLEDLVICGRGFRYVAPDNIDGQEEDDESPFEIQNVDCDSCEVVYSNGIDKAQLFAFVDTPMQEQRTRITPEGAEEFYWYDYDVYTVYTKNRVYTYTTQNGFIEYVKPTTEENIKLYPEGHRIVEYSFNRSRLSLIEVIKPILDKINQIESLDLDDIEQFVNSIMVFKNANITEETIAQGKELGALLLKSDGTLPADMDLLQARLKASDTQVTYQRLIGAMLSIIAMPYSSDNGSYGDTGVAKMTGQGWTMADQRSSPLATSFGDGDRKILKYVLKVCRETNNSDIKNLKISDIDIRFKINKNANILEKTQALLNMKTAQIAPSIAIPTSKIFNDDQNAIVESENFYGKDSFWKGETNNNKNNPVNDEITAQNNAIQDIEQVSKQKGV